MKIRNITKKFDGMHYAYRYPDDMGNVGVTAVCDETGDIVVLEVKHGLFTGNILNEYGIVLTHAVEVISD